MFPSHRIPQSNHCYVPRPQGSRIKPQSCSQPKSFQSQASDMFLGHKVPQSNLRHLPRYQGSRIKPQSCSQATSFQNKPQTCSQATGFQNQNSVMFPGQRVPQSNLSHVPREQGSTTNPQSCAQGTGFQKQTTVMFPGQRVRSEERRVGKECLRLCRSRWSPDH